MVVRLFILIFFGILTFYGEVRSQERKKVPSEVSLPEEVNGWKWDGKRTRYNSRTLFDYINGAAELYLAYGFQNLSVRRLEKPGQPPIILELYEMETPEDAFGVFTFERQDEEVGIGQGSEFGGGLLRFWKGKYFVAIYAEGESSEVERALIRCGQKIAQAIPQSAALPKILQFLPPGYLERSLRYLKNHVLLNQRFFIAQKNILNLHRQTEAILAQYTRYKQRMHLLLIRYPSLAEAKAAGESFQRAYMPEAVGKDRLLIEDKRWVFFKHFREYLLLILDAPDETGGEELLRKLEKNLRG